MSNDLLQIEPLEKRDYGVYSCLFEDEYGERKLQYQVDEKIIESGGRGGDEAVANDSGYVNSAEQQQRYQDSVQTLDGPRVVARMGDLAIDVTAVKNVKNRIMIKCRNQFGKNYYNLLLLLLFSFLILKINIVIFGNYVGNNELK